LTGIAVADERALAGRLLGWMLGTGAIVTNVLPLLPGAETALFTPTLPLAGVVLAWGLIAVTRFDWEHAPGWVVHASVTGGALAAAVAVADTGGAGSPARFLLILALVYAAYFFPAREAWPYLPFVIALHALPFVYEFREAFEAELIGELAIVAPIYWLLASLLITGKRGMIEARARADKLAREDALTGLANRRALLEALGGTRREDDQVGLLMLDVDDFKRMNTLHGHPGGDRALVFVADCLRRCCRAGDLPARLGGDEFAVLARGIDEAGMEALAERVLATVRAGGMVRVSAGWVLGRPDAETLLREADGALAQAKRRGKDQYATAAR
jgi:diguanylate cyclase (GGDEF)-like protein